MSEKIVKINIELFKTEYNNIAEIPSNILEKVADIKNSYSCFNSYYDPKMIWAKKIFNNKDKYNKPKVKNRVHIIIPEFTKTSETKRSLIGYLNKLSNKNKDFIYEKLKDIIDNSKDTLDEIFSIIINYIKTNDDNIYSDILDFFDKDFLTSNINIYWDNYLTNKEWNPPTYIYENNLLLLNDEYDLYCDYIKWKKSIHNMNKVWVKYKESVLIILLNNICEHINYIINEDVHKYILDILLEQIYKILCIKKYPEIIDKIKNIDLKKFDNSTKFLIYNIIEL
jgi:hypothetical protein